MAARKTNNAKRKFTAAAVSIAVILLCGFSINYICAEQHSLRKPVVSLSSGTYHDSKLVRISGRSAECRIYYTLNGRTPTRNSRLYKRPVRISRDTTLKARCYSGSRHSAAVTARYKIIKTKGEPREAAHGISFVQKGNSGWLIWSDQYGRKSDNGNWEHDVYAQKISLADPSLDPGQKKTIVSAPEAQEPASASSTKDGNIMVTFEDGYNNGEAELSQRFAVFDSDMNVVKKYDSAAKTGAGTNVKLGGHSGHTASTDGRHVIVWCEDWIDGGGVDNLGTGKRTGLTVYDKDGSRLASRWIANGQGRYWWPTAAASHDRVLITWQEYIKGQEYANLMTAVYDPERNVFVQKPKRPDKSLQLLYYTYSSVYLPESGCFLILAGTYDEKTNAYLVDENGNIKAQRRGLPGLVRESSPAVRSSGGGNVAVYPNLNNGVTYISVGKKGIKKLSDSSDKHRWSYRGTAGFFDSDGAVWFASLESEKLALIKFPGF
jgi:hypothetical protein